MGNNQNKTANGRQVVFLSHFKEEASAEARLLKMMLLNEMADKKHGLSKTDIFLDSDNLHKISELLDEVKRSENLVVLLTKRVLTRPWCLLELWAAHQNGVNIVPVKIECRGADRMFEFGPPADAFQNNLSRKVDRTCIEQVVQHGATIPEIQVAIAELLNNIACNFSVDASERQQKAQVLDIIDRFRAARPMMRAKEKQEGKVEQDGTKREQEEQERHEEIEHEIKQKEEKERLAATCMMNPRVFCEICRRGQTAKVADVLEVAREDPERLRALLDHREPNQSTPLHIAAFLNDEAIARLLLEAGADRDAHCENEGTPLHGTPLHMAASQGQEAIVRLLLDAGTDLDAQTKDGMTPLHVAASFGQEAMVRFLLDTGADKNAKDKGGRTPLAWAESKGCMDRGSTNFTRIIAMLR